jgi:PIN like domain
MNWRTITPAAAKRLKKRSVANSVSRKPPEDLTFFLDRQLGRYKMAAILRAADLRVEVHDDHFAQDAKDNELLSAVSERGWIFTRDERIRYRVAERKSLRRGTGRAFVLAAQGNLRAEMLAENLLKALPGIRRIIAQHNPPFLAKISRNGDVTLLPF